MEDVFLMTKTEKDEARGAGRVAFWAHRESIKKMLEDKHTVMATYRAHKKEVNIGHAQFRRYVNEFIRNKPDETKHPEEGNAKKPAPRKPAAAFKRNIRDDLVD